jgi:hypothetical protein
MEQTTWMAVAPVMQPSKEERLMRMLFNTLAVAAAVMATTALTSPQARADRVCRQECSAGVCTERCVESTERERDKIVIEGRGERREEKREERPGIELKAPGVGVEIGH